MSNSLIEELPKIVAQGKKEAQRILDGLSNSNRITLQTNELVLPANGKGGYLGQQVKEISKKEWFNRLIYGDNLLAMQALLAGNSKTLSMRGKIDLIYIDPPFDSKADYRTKIKLPDTDIEERPTVIEQFAYSDTWAHGTASYLRMIVPRLVLMRELLSEQGSIYVHTDWHVGHYVKVIMDDIFGKDNFINEVIWAYRIQGVGKNTWARKHDTLLFYGKTKGYKFHPKKERIYYKKKFIDTKVDEQGRFYSDVYIRDVWDGDETKPFISGSNEYLGYRTQKPRGLLKRIIESVTAEGDFVADFFAGTGTTGAVAEELGRRWIMCDLGKPACMITRKRLIDQDAKPFLYQAIGDYQKEQFEASKLFRRIGDLAHVVVNLYGALPFPQHEGVPNNLGYIKQSKTLVFVDSPSKMTGYSTLKKAQELRNSFMGGWNNVVVLGWNFVTDIGQVINSLNDSKLEVLVIPPDLWDKLKTKAGYQKLIKTRQVRFSSLQYLTVKKPIQKRGYNGEDELVVELDNYILLSPDALPLDEKNKEKLEKVIAEDPLSLVEYWSIDPDYDGEVFRSKWQDYRGNSFNGDDPFRVAKKTKLVVPKNHGVRKVCVKAVDVFSFESVAVCEVN
jgi:adenine specific DNA methylase Mod